MMLRVSCSYALLPFRIGENYGLSQSHYFNIEDRTYEIRYTYNYTGKFYAIHISDKSDARTLFIGKLTPLNLALYVKDADTAQILFTIVPINTAYGNVTAMAVW